MINLLLAVVAQGLVRAINVRGFAAAGGQIGYSLFIRTCMEMPPLMSNIGLMPERQLARRILQLIDLTSLNLDDTDSAIQRLCQQAVTRFGTTAAVCVYPPFIAAAKQALSDAGGRVKVATVTNFPAGEANIAHAVAETQEAVAAGADEVDLVFPYEALQAGDEQCGLEMVQRCREICGNQVLLKVIIESGQLEGASLIRRASRIAIAAGADFIKTSTGKVAINATPEAARVMLEAIRESGKPVGFKAAGGIRTVAEAAQYLAIADEVMGPEWATPATFRFGASSLLADVLGALGAESRSLTGSY